MQTDEDSEMFEAFSRMSQVWEAFSKSPEDENARKKTKKESASAQGHQAAQAMKVMQAMGSLLLKLDAEQQVWKKQDSWICFMQTDPQAMLPLLMTQAHQWKKAQDQVKLSKVFQETYTPLRSHLMQVMAQTLLERLKALMDSEETSQMRQTALKHGVLNKEGLFPFQRWNQHTQQLQISTQTPIHPSRMLKHAEHFLELAKDPGALQKFQALKPADNLKVVPWLLQISIRQDDLQILLTQLQGCTVWNLLGMQMKPHNQLQSKPALTLKGLLGKGSNQGGPTHPPKGKGKSRS